MKKLWIDYLRALSALAVVVIHVTAPFYARFPSLSAADWWLADIVNSSVRFAVPMYVMISGALLLGRDTDAPSFYRRRAARLIPPLAFWSAFYLLFSSFAAGEGFPGVLSRFKHDLLLGGQAYYHLWYLPMFIGLMLAHPFVNGYLMGRKPGRVELAALFAVFAGFMLLGQGTELLAALKGVRVAWYGAFVWYLGYYVAGHVLDRRGGIALPGGLLAGTAAAIVAAGSVANHVMASRFGLFDDQYVLFNTGLAVFALTAAIFCLFRNNAHAFRENRLVASVADASFGIYLIHPFFLYFERRYLPGYYGNALLYIPLSAITVFAASWASVAALRRLEFFRRLC